MVLMVCFYKMQIKLWVFPEGTRRNTGDIHPFKKGAFHMAIQAQIPILPVVFSSYYFLDSSKKYFDQGTFLILHEFFLILHLNPFLRH